ncbi:hypothetical protein D3C86_1592280 [compost metagenome]
MGHVVVGLRLHQQDIPGELRAGMQGTIAVGTHQGASVITQIQLVQVAFRRVPLLVAIQRRHPQRQPAHRSERGQDRGQITPVTGADHGNRRGIEGRVREQAVIGRQQVTQIVFPGHPGQWDAGATSVPAQVEGQAYTTQPGDAFGALQIPLLAAAPAVHEEHAGDFRFGAQEGPAHLFVVDVDLNGFASSRHRI